ncbi:MAG TPA: 4Fe-4S dicluster domain-containing protein, partial [Caldimonas sp.]|nr:4Fe-4S dicluster domain-containing protein [Caldimonas sp.]
MPDRVDGEPLHFHPRDTQALTRRSALGVMAASLALASGACTRPPRERIYPAVGMPEDAPGERPLYYASAFVRDGHALGVRVGTQQGRPIKIEGNPLHPSSLGATDVFTQASVLELWDPDRSSAVLQRLGTSRESAPLPPSATSSWEAFESMWRARAALLRAQGGAGLRVLTGPISSPTERALLAGLLERHPRARWHQDSPLRDVAADAGARAAFGRRVQTVLHLDRARCIVALAADPFSDGPGAVRCALDWSHGRDAGRNGSGELPRLFAAEVGPGLFGARADVRIAAPPQRIDALVRRLAARIVDGSDPGPDSAATPAETAFETALVAALASAGSDAVIVPGAALAAESHAAVHAIHQRIGAGGRTLDLIAPLAFADEAGSLAELVDAIVGGSVDTLVVVDANPLYDAPGALDVAAAFAKVGTTIHAGLYRDETAHACAWHLPLSHDYERWGDALAHDGSATLVQPAIAPLYATRSPIELLALVGGDEDPRDGHRLVQRTWRAHASGGDFAAWWEESLRRGVVENSSATPLVLRPRAQRVDTTAAAVAAPPGELVAVFTADPSVHDGRFANSAWLQELPRPNTKLTWDNALLLGPATAIRQRLGTGDVVRATIDGRTIEAPVWVSAMHAEGALTLPLGYGRRDAGRVGNGIGFDAYRLRPADAAIGHARIERLDKRHDFAVTQHTISQSGRDLARTVAPGGRIADPGLDHDSLYPRFTSPEHAWAMAIDLDACIGCNACTIACQAENNIPTVGKDQVMKGREMHWIRVDRYETADVAGVIFQPVPCMHCERAPCELVCPVGATVHSAEGLNDMVYNRCVGTRYCSNNCPYKVRRFNFLLFQDWTTPSFEPLRNPDVTVRSRGVMEKCTYCVQRINYARIDAKRHDREIRDGEVVPACAATCPADAIIFGNL